MSLFSLVVPPSSQLAQLIAQSLASLLWPQIKKEIDMQYADLLAQYKGAADAAVTALNAATTQLKAQTDQITSLNTKVDDLQKQLEAATTPDEPTEQEVNETSTEVGNLAAATAAVNAIVSPEPAQPPSEDPAPAV